VLGRGSDLVAGEAFGNGEQAAAGEVLGEDPPDHPGGVRVVYGMSRIDASGRLTSQSISHVLNWQPGDRLTLTADAGGPCATVIFTLPG
jgi:hypothetical protein